jgi:hypothetical protein
VTIEVPMPSLRRVLALPLALASLALVASSSPGARAVPGDEPDPRPAVEAVIPAGWRVYPAAARPGEVVHVRFPLTVAVGAAPPVAYFAFTSDIGHSTVGVYDPARHVFGVDLVVPPGTDWGSDPILVSAQSFGITGLFSQRLIAQLPFVTTRSAQPPLWVR